MQTAAPCADAPVSHPAPPSHSCTAWLKKGETLTSSLPLKHRTQQLKAFRAASLESALLRTHPFHTQTENRDAYKPASLQALLLPKESLNLMSQLKIHNWMKEKKSFVLFLRK